MRNCHLRATISIEDARSIAGADESCICPDSRKATLTTLFLLLRRDQCFKSCFEHVVRVPTFDHSQRLRQPRLLGVRRRQGCT